VPDTAEVVAAISSLVVFGPDQAGAYRELADSVMEQLGDDVSTRLNTWLHEWGMSPGAGLVILTGNAGTGKTAATQHFCRALGEDLPKSDEMSQIGSALVVKDASGIPSRAQRAAMFQRALRERATCKILVCANEGVLRDAAEDLVAESNELMNALDEVLRSGVCRTDAITIINVNRQRLTSEALWDPLLDYLVREELWLGCDSCPGGEDADGCPMRRNARALREPSVRAVLRQAIRLCSGEMTPTLREVLALLAYAICGGVDTGQEGALTWSCVRVSERYRDRGREAFTASVGYYNLLFGAGLDPETRERSPLLDAMDRLGCGPSADLVVDAWLRDPGNGGDSVRVLAGVRPADREQVLSGSTSHLDRVRTELGERTFAEVGETAAISEIATEVSAATKALVAGEHPAIQSWRRRVLLEAPEQLGGVDMALGRLSALPFAAGLLALAERVSSGASVINQLNELVRGLNFLVTGSSSSSDGLIVPDPASLFARNPGAFRPALPAFVNARVPLAQLSLSVPDGPIVAEFLDIDHVEVVLHLLADPHIRLRIGPRLYQAISEAGRYRGPVGQGTAEMTDLRAFYGRLAASDDAVHETSMIVADPARGALVSVQLPQFV
jgi:hypothetical protein